MKKQCIAIELENDIVLIMPRDTLSNDALSAFILLGGLLYHGFVETEEDKEKFKGVVDSCFDYIKKGDFSELAKKVKRKIVLEKDIFEA